MRAPIALAMFVIVALARTTVAEPRDRTVLAEVPATALAFIGIDLARARVSPAMMTAVSRLVRATDLEDRADAIAAAASLVIAGVPGLRGPTMFARGPAPPRALVFGAIWLDASAQRRLAQILPDLGAIQWIAGTLEQSSAGFSLSGSAAFADPYVAARIAVAIGMGRKVVTSQLPANVAVAIDKLAITAMGSSIRISAMWSEADLAAVLASP